MERVQVICAGTIENSFKEKSAHKLAYICKVPTQINKQTNIYIYISTYISDGHIPSAIALKVQHFSCHVQFAYIKLQENGITQLSLLSALSHYDGIWTNEVLRGILSGENLQPEQGEFSGWFQSSLTILRVRVFFFLYSIICSCY